MRDLPFAEPTLADVLARVLLDKNVRQSRKRDFQSACRALEKMTGLRVEAVPATAEQLGRCLAPVMPAAHGIGAKRFSNIKSDLLHLLRKGGQVGPRQRSKLSDRWQPIWDELPDKYARSSMSRFFRYCSENSLRPEDVDADVSAQFLAFLQSETIVKDARVVHQTMCRAWNQHMWSR